MNANYFQLHINPFFNSSFICICYMVWMWLLWRKKKKNKKHFDYNVHLLNLQINFLIFCVFYFNFSILNIISRIKIKSLELMLNCMHTIDICDHVLWIWTFILVKIFNFYFYSDNPIIYSNNVMDWYEYQSAI